MEILQNCVTALSEFLTDKVMVTVLLIAAGWFTIRLNGVQFSMIPEMVRLLVKSGKNDADAKGHTRHVSSFQAFALSIASRVGTGNLAGVATAITLGGPGAVFWMWVIALFGASSAFVESTLAQLFKERSADGAFVGGPAYYIRKGLGSKLWAGTFAVLIILTFGFAFSSVQANTISGSLLYAFGIDTGWTAAILGVVTLAIIIGGIHRISRFSEIVVPAMAVAYILLAVVIIILHVDRIPHVFAMIVGDAFGLDSALGGTVGMALTMGVKRGLFSNEAGEGSTPNAAATATVSHPVKQGLIQALGVYTDTLLVCSATAFIILVGLPGLSEGVDGIMLTQAAIDAGLGGSHRLGSTFIAVAVLLFAFTSIIANTYYGEANLRILFGSNRAVPVYRAAVVAMVVAGALMPLGLVWGLADITMALMTLCNIAAIALLGPYTRRLLADYRAQKRLGRNPVYHTSTIPELKGKTEAWD